MLIRYSNLPVIVSLEVHASPPQQDIMVEIMKYTFKGHLISVPSAEIKTLPSPASLRNKILIKVKYVHGEKKLGAIGGNAAKKAMSDPFARKKSEVEISSSDSEDNDVPATDPQDGNKKKKSSHGIIPSLSDLGVYTRSYHFSDLNSPEATVPTHVFSLSEKKLMEVHENLDSRLFSHNRNFLMRAFPSGLRVRSDNLDPSVFWRKGVQMVALNWQRWDEGMMLNEGMFVGTGGWMLKPEGYLSYRASEAGEGKEQLYQAIPITRKTLDLEIEILAAQDIPLPLGERKSGSLRPYVKCELHVEKQSERTGKPIEGGGKSKEGEYKHQSQTSKGVDVDFAAEKVVFRNVPEVFAELSFLR